MLRLYYCNFSDISDNECEIIRNRISPCFKSKSSLKRKDSVMARALLWQVLREDFGLLDFSVDSDENGKPFIEESSICFNLSHSGSLALCAVSDGAVGCDVEVIHPCSRKIAQRFFTKAEAELLEKSECADLVFTRLWTMKESILKCLGTGLSGGLSEYDFSLFTGERCFEAHNLFFNLFDIPEHVVCVCSRVGEDLTLPVEKNIIV